MRILKNIAIFILAALSLTSCKLSCDCGGIVIPESYDKVMILYSAGKNSLSSDLKEDINDLCSGYVPGVCSGDALIVISHLNDPKVITPIVENVYTNLKGVVVRDTIMVLENGSMLTDKDVMRSTLARIEKTFKAKSYGMIYSSHATGWLPPGAYDNPGAWKSGARLLPRPDGSVPYIEPTLADGEPRVKSIGQTALGVRSYEMELKDFADALPFKLDYLLFDACLMGGIETAYELRGHCDLLGFSQAEILAEGLNYRTMGERLLKGSEPDVLGVCKDYFEFYNAQSGVMRSATISLVDCRKLEPLADICRKLFDDKRAALAMLTDHDVQRYYRYNKKWFFDLQDILEKCVLSPDDSAALLEALDGCVIYKAATPEFMLDYSGFRIDTHCGLSMYLPSEGSSALDATYRELEWNKATELVEYD